MVFDTPTLFPPLTKTSTYGFWLGCLLLTAGNLAMAGVRLGQGEVIFDASLSTTYNSNVTGNQRGGESIYLSFAPGVTYNRENALVKSRAEVGVDFEHYFTGPLSDRQNLSGSLSAEIAEGTFGNYSTSIDASYAETSDANPDVNAGVVQETTSVSASGTISLKRGVSLTANASYAASGASGYASNDTLSAGVGLNLPLGQRNGAGFNYSHRETNATSVGTVIAGLDQSSDSVVASLSRQFRSGVSSRLGVGYTWLSRSAGETNSGITSDESFTVSASVDGPFLPPRKFPKLKSSVSVAYSTAETPGLNDLGGEQLTGAVRLSWEARLNTNVSTTLSRERSLSLTNFTADSTRLNLALTQGFVSGWSMNASAGYEWRTLRGLNRDSELLTAQVGGGQSYGKRDQWRLRGSYSYTSSASTDAIADYHAHLVTLAVSYRY